MEDLKLEIHVHFIWRYQSRPTFISSLRMRSDQHASWRPRSILTTHVYLIFRYSYEESGLELDDLYKSFLTWNILDTIISQFQKLFVSLLFSLSRLSYISESTTFHLYSPCMSFVLAVRSKHERAALAQTLGTVAKWAFVGSGMHRALWMPHLLQY